MVANLPLFILQHKRMQKLRLKKQYSYTSTPPVGLRGTY
jgi:hypothetical protein